MAPDNNQDPLDRMVVAYENMLQRVDDLLQKAEKTAIPTLKKSLEHAREKAVELDELTREEAEK
ncbi:MAG: zinc ribbon-containing protein, partial [Gammaproteobacteria bacterium]|nr:zinc ribbon-containing protein [Gammaproteobacteria bacterium]